jgi:hypothetical protein
MQGAIRMRAAFAFRVIKIPGHPGRRVTPFCKTQNYRVLLIMFVSRPVEKGREEGVEN